MTDSVLQIWTIYDHPKDLPDNFVARLYLIDGSGGVHASDETLVTKSLETLRAQMQKWGLTCITRDPNDDPVIVETWI